MPIYAGDAIPQNNSHGAQVRFQENPPPAPQVRQDHGSRSHRTRIRSLLIWSACALGAIYVLDHAQEGLERTYETLKAGLIFDGGKHQIPPNHQELLKKLKLLLGGKGWPEASDLTEQFTASGKGTAETDRQLGFYLLNDYQYARSVELLEKVVQIGKADAWVFHALGHGYDGLGHYEKALKSFERAKQVDPQSPEHYRCAENLIQRLAHSHPELKEFVLDSPAWR